MGSTSSQKLAQFKEVILKIKDEKMLEVAESLLNDMLDIENYKEKIEKLEESLVKGDRAAFYFFADCLDKETLHLAASTVKGRKSFLKNKQDKIDASKRIEKEKAEENKNL